MKRPTGIHDLHNLKKSYEKKIIMIIIMITIITIIIIKNRTHAQKFEL